MKPVNNLLESPRYLTNHSNCFTSKTTKKVNSLTENGLGVKNNADLTLTNKRTAVYCFIDGMGGTRQVVALVESGAKLSQAAATANLASAIVPIGLLVTGPLSVATAIGWTIPDAYEALQKAEQERDNSADPVAIDEAEHVLELARLGLANQSLYLTMGLAQTSSGVVAMTSEGAAHVFHYTPVLTGQAASIAATVTGIALGAIYVARGMVMLTRAIKSYVRANDFHNQFRGCFKGEAAHSIQDAFDLMKDAEGKDSYLGRRMDVSCLEKRDKEGNLIGKYTSSGFVSNKGVLRNYNNDAERLEYLKGVDKGIYTEKLQQKVAIGIASAMILGGILAIVLTVLTAGTAPIIIGLASAIFFIGMEYVFMVYDSSAAFEWLRDRLYGEPNLFKESEGMSLDPNPVVSEISISRS